MLHKNKALVILAMTMAVLLTFAACSAKSTDNFSVTGSASSSGMTYAPEVDKEDIGYNSASDSGGATDGSSAGAPSSVQLDDRKVIKYVDLAMETKEFDAALEKILAEVAAAGGYVESQSVNRRNLGNTYSYYSRSASITARIPSDKLGDVTAVLGTICNISSENTRREDITDYYYDTDAHLQSLKLQEERLLAILAKAERLEDVIELENALSDVRYQIESLSGQLRRMDNQVSYSYLNMDLSEVVEYTEGVAQPKTFGEKLKIAGSNAITKLGDTCEGAVLFIVEDGPVIILWLAFLLLLAWLVIRLIRWLNSRSAARRARRMEQIAAQRAQQSAPAPKPEGKKE